MFCNHRYRKACIYFLFMRQCDGWKVICLTLGAEIRKRPCLVTNGDLETWFLESPLHHQRHATEQVSRFLSFPQQLPFSSPTFFFFLQREIYSQIPLTYILTANTILSCSFSDTFKKLHTHTCIHAYSHIYNRYIWHNIDLTLYSQWRQAIFGSQRSIYYKYIRYIINYDFLVRFRDPAIFLSPIWLFNSTV